jgi:peptidoglycan LD-endopeptidase LytH
MARAASRIKRAFFVLYMIVVHAALIALLAERFLLPRILPPANLNTDAVRDPVPGPQVAPATLPTELPEPVVEPSSIPTPFPTIAANVKIIIPVQGVLPQQLIDTFTQARSENRGHDAIDIIAPVGTPVLAAADGEIAKFFDSERGGTTIYQITADRKYFLYYAHLQRRAEGISEKQFVRQGTTIGYVGDTGNAGPGNYHLHFAISTVSDPNRFWDGTPINPYPILTGRAELW